MVRADVRAKVRAIARVMPRAPACTKVRTMVCIVERPAGLYALPHRPCSGTEKDGAVTQDELKQAAAKAALSYVEQGYPLGVGTGSTVNFLIAELARANVAIPGAVASSEATAKLLQQAGIPVLELNSVNELPVYIDGADEVTAHLAMIKGGGGALTREKIVAAVARKFVCVVDETKFVPVLGRFPLPIEVIPMARSYVARRLVALGGQPALRMGFTTDNGNLILDVKHLEIADPVALETEINQIAGVVCCGLFARRPADVLLVARQAGVETIRAPK